MCAARHNSLNAFAKTSFHNDKTAARLKQILATKIAQLSDPQLGVVSVSDLVLSRDLRYAKVFITVVGCDSELAAEDSLQVLRRASGFLSKSMESNQSLRFIPKFQFLYDGSGPQARRIDTLLKDVVADKQE